MAQPSPYERGYDFEGFQSGHPATPPPGDKLNEELDSIASTIDDILDRIARLQDDDLAVKRNSIGYDQLKAEVDLGFNPPETWTTDREYAARDTVLTNAAFYRCVTAHVSGVFADDLADGKWTLVADFTEATTAAQAAQAAAEAAEAAAELAQTAAEAAKAQAITSAANAATSASQAATSATAASDSADAASSSAGAASASATAAGNSASAAAASQAAAAASASAAADSADEAAASAASLQIGQEGGVQAYAANLDTLAGMPAGVARDAVGRFDTVANAEAATLAAAPEFIETAGYNSAGDGGGAVYANPVTADPGTSDAISVQIGSPAVQYWLRRVHEEGSVDLIKHGLYGDANSNALREESAAFVDAIALAADLGVNKIHSPGGRSFRLVEAAITVDVEIDMGGSELSGDYNGEYANKTATLITATDVDFTLRRAKIDGHNLAQAPSGNNGVPLLWIEMDGNTVELDRVELLNGANRDSTVHTLLKDYTNAECLIRGNGLIRIDRSKFWSSPGEMLQLVGDNADLLFQITRTVFDKTRSHDPGANYSTSGINAFDCHPASGWNFVWFNNFVKSAANLLMHGGLFQNTRIDGVSDSNGLDFNEAGLFRFDGATIINLVAKNIAGAAVRSSGSDVTVDRLDSLNNLYGVLFEGNVSGDPAAGAWLKTDDVALRNNRVSRVLDRGTDKGSTARSVKAVGASSSLPISLHVDGLREVAGSTSPTYGIHAENCDLTVSGFVDVGDAALVYMAGVYGDFTAKEARFKADNATATHVLLLDGAGGLTMNNPVAFRNSKREGSLLGGASDVRELNSPNAARGYVLDNSDSITTFSNTLRRAARSPALSGSVAYNPPSLAAGARATTTVTVTGVTTTGAWQVWATHSSDLLGVVIERVRVSAADTLEVTFYNPTAGALDPASGTLYGFAQKP